MHPKFKQRLLQQHARAIAKKGQLAAMIEFRNKFGPGAYREVVKGETVVPIDLNRSGNEAGRAAMKRRIEKRQAEEVSASRSERLARQKEKSGSVVPMVRPSPPTDEDPHSPQ